MPRLRLPHRPHAVRARLSRVVPAAVGADAQHVPDLPARDRAGPGPARAAPHLDAARLARSHQPRRTLCGRRRRRRGARAPRRQAGWRGGRSVRLGGRGDGGGDARAAGPHARLQRRLWRRPRLHRCRPRRQRRRRCCRLELLSVPPGRRHREAVCGGAPRHRHARRGQRRRAESAKLLARRGGSRRRRRQHAAAANALRGLCHQPRREVGGREARRTAQR
mmetsp:Transcript_3170/g.9128  ORF Transcript_3170/g.9128 Transcript_3170/m.9128 type:complete len:221 (-) Transcript_3170:634-1296(-)